MIDINALRAEWVKNGLRQKDVASMIGVNPKTLSLKLKKVSWVVMKLIF